MNEQQTLQWLKDTFPRHKLNDEEIDKAYTRLVSPEINLDTPEIQSYMMSNWWNTMFSIIRQKEEDPRLPLFINKLTWSKLVRFDGEIQMRDSDLAKQYDGESISWFHFGILSTPHIISDAVKYVADFERFASLENSKGQTSWHVLAEDLKINCSGRNQEFLVNIISKYNANTILKKDNAGETFEEILEKNIAFNKLPRGSYEIRYPQESLKSNESLLKILRQENLSNLLREKPMGLIKKKKI